MSIVNFKKTEGKESLKAMGVGGREEGSLCMLYHREGTEEEEEEEKKEKAKVERKREGRKRLLFFREESSRRGKEMFWVWKETWRKEPRYSHLIPAGTTGSQLV